MPDLLKAKNYAEHPVKVKAKSGSDIYYVARVKVTGPIEGALKGCRFWYRQGSQQYQHRRARGKLCTAVRNRGRRCVRSYIWDTCCSPEP